MRLTAHGLLLVIAAIVAVMAPPSHAEDTADAHLHALLARMTLEEKVGQLNLLSRSEPSTGQQDAVRRGEVGAMLNVIDPAEISAFRAAARASRLRIPLVFGLDAVNVFRIAMPSPLAWAATWQPDLASRAAEMVAREAASVGITWTFAPMVDVTRDARWGRVVEGAGEDPLLASAMARARVVGYRRGGLSTSVKHFIGYGAAEAGRDYNGASIPTSELLDRYLPPFIAAIDAGSDTVMAAFNTVNGVPVSASRGLLTDLLRQRLRFKGVVTSDYNAIAELQSHGTAATLADAARSALQAGIDIDMEGRAYARHLADEARAGRVSMTAIDDAVLRVLRWKARLGLFEHADAVVPSAPPEADVRAVAREVARRSLVLLKNDGDALPLRNDRRIALLGAMAENDYDMSWWGPARMTRPQTETLLAAMRRLSSVSGGEITYARAFADACGRSLVDRETAMRTARAADVVVIAISEDCEVSGEGASRAHLELSAPHQELIDAVAALGKPIVLVVDTGRPLVLTRAAPRVSAILVAWQGGTEGRTALAEILLGQAAPSGKLPMSFPRAVGQLPMSYDMLPTSRPPGPDRYTSRYLDEDVSPLYPFGHGLTYTRFAYSDLTLPQAHLAADGRLAVRVKVSNVGARPGRDVVQLYVRQLVASRSRPVRQLKAFATLDLDPGASREVLLDVAVSDLGFHDDDGAYRLEPGPFQLWVGGSSTTDLSTRFVIACTPAEQVQACR